MKQGNVLEEEYLAYLEKNNKVKKMLLNTTPAEVRKVDANLPLSGLEQYEMVKKKWHELGFKTLKDLLRFYNLMDVVPFAKAIQNYSRELRDNHVDMFANGISLPGLAKKILSRYMYKGSMYYLNDMEIINIVKKSEVGG